MFNVKEKVKADFHDHVTVKITIPEFDWAYACRVIRWITPNGTLAEESQSTTNGVKTEHGTILFDENERGKVYVCGIYVQSVADLKYGYDFANKEMLDVDRAVIASYKIAEGIMTIWNAALLHEQISVQLFFNMLIAGCGDIKEFTYNGAANFSAEVRNSLVALWRATYGVAIPVCGDVIAERLTFYGIQHKSVSPAAERVFTEITKTAKVAIEEKVAATINVSTAVLSNSEQKQLSKALKLLGSSGNVALPANTSVIEGEFDGFYHEIGDVVDVHRRLLREDNFSNLLVVLIHELAHRRGLDGTLEHRVEFERIVQNMFKFLLQYSRLSNDLL